MVSKMRAQRIADRIREELSEMLIQEISDPRLSEISVTDVNVDRELSYANIYVSALEGSERSEEVLAGLEHAKGYLRHELAQRIELRTFPYLRFHWDATFEHADKIERLIASLHEEENLSASQARVDKSIQKDIEDDA
jgi:ribosome-binding factor A